MDKLSNETFLLQEIQKMSRRNSLLNDGFSKEHSIMLIGFILIRFLYAFLFPVFGDACRYSLMAKAISENPFLLARKGLTYPSPLFLMIGAFFYRFFSIIGTDCGFTGVRLISPISGSLTIFFTYMICRRLFGRRGSFYPILFLGLSPSHILISSIGYMESLFVLFVTLAIYFLIRDDPPTGKSAALSGLALGLASLTRVTGLLLIIIIVVYLLTRRRLLTSSTRLGLSVLIVSCALIVSGPYYGRELYEFGSVEMIGQVFPPREEPISLDSLLYQVEVTAERSEVQYQDMHYNPWFRIIGTYFEFWGIWGGAVNVLFRTGVLGFPLLVLTGFTVITLFLTYFHLYGGITLKGKQEYVLLHLCVFLLFSVFFAYVAIQSLRQGFISVSMGYRKPLITVAPILAIYGGHGVDRVIKRLGGKRFPRVLIESAVVASLLILLLAVGFEGFYMRERYEITLLGAAGWIKQNVSKAGVIITTRSLEIAYLADRRTVSLSLVAPQAVNRDLFETHSISHVLIPVKELAQNRSLDPYMRRFQILEDEGVLREVYRDSRAFVLEIVDIP